MLHFIEISVKKKGVQLLGTGLTKQELAGLILYQSSPVITSSLEE